ncbi:Hint domain-containing protein [uncultured Roseobacter sp.]|uniref:Hint domain-containing protein n=1 Tax=uncultured Roseobacter sp. TaxID=114847 RepID=UPI002610FDF8|nr:Hint domain-containing protein [uncultured Roseobacter sp.]
MTTPPPAATPTFHRDRSGQAHASSRPIATAGTLDVRIVDVKALRGDGDIITSQHKIPTLPIFENAFSAFARGTPLQTSAGFVAIEDLQPGDRVLTVDGSARQVTWIGSACFAPSDRSRRHVVTRLMADCFGINRPDSFLSLGPAARLLQTPPHLRAETGDKQRMTLASGFVDGVNIIEVTPPTPVRMFHLSLDRHTAVIAGGLEVETYHPGVDPMRPLSHTLQSVFLSLFPHLTDISAFGPMTYDRTDEESDPTPM